MNTVTNQSAASMMLEMVKVSFCKTVTRVPIHPACPIDEHQSLEGTVKSHPWVGKASFSHETSRDSLFLTVQSKVRKSNVRLRSIGQFFCEFDFVRLCSAIELSSSIMFD